jgi:hypothetical protein
MRGGFEKSHREYQNYGNTEDEKKASKKTGGEQM